MPKRPDIETLQHHEAFEFWYWSKPRTLDKVRERFGVSGRTVEIWSAKFAWERRAQERDAKLKRDLEDKHDAEAVKARAQLIQVADATLARYAVRLLKDPDKRAEQGATAYEPTASDASRWAQMKLLLTGQATSRTEVNLGRGFVEAFMAMVTAVLRKEIPRSCPTCKTALGLHEAVGRALVEASARLGTETDPKALPAPARGTGENPDAAGPTE